MVWLRHSWNLDCHVAVLLAMTSKRRNASYKSISTAGTTTPGGDVCDRRLWTARERRQWRRKRPKQLGRHLRLHKRSAVQTLSVNPGDEGSKKEWQRSKKWSKRSANIFSGTATGEGGLFQSSSCCGSQNQQSLVYSLLILTTATRSPRLLCHWQRSDRSPYGSFSPLSFVTRQKIGPSETDGTFMTVKG